MKTLYTAKFRNNPFGAAGFVELKTDIAKGKAHGRFALGAGPNSLSGTFSEATEKIAPGSRAIVSSDRLLLPAQIVEERDPSLVRPGESKYAKHDGHVEIVLRGDQIEGELLIERAGQPFMSWKFHGEKGDRYRKLAEGELAEIAEETGAIVSTNPQTETEAEKIEGMKPYLIGGAITLGAAAAWALRLLIR